MNTRLLLIAIAAETDIVLVRKRTRRLAELIGFDAQDQTRITTAVSEIARNAYEYAGGGQIEFRLTARQPRNFRHHRARPRARHRRPAAVLSRVRTSPQPEWASGCWARNA